jgi:DCN1-like protein 1/2
MYNKYKDEKDEKIYSDGIEKLCEDLEISIEDKVLLVIAYESNAKQMGLFTKNEFIMAI